ncbi:MULTISPECIES: 5-oxoprolinase subunit PxpB [unclassified Serinicoccus]|uniref:5-oxoprolinase subunit PxpB n=1 Tax=unclassified Serinicoccus TaxID=2643101 RepID=UPI003854DCDF
MRGRLLPMGADAVLVEVAGTQEVLTLGAALQAAPWRGTVAETVPAARTVLVRVHDPRQLPGVRSGLAELLAATEVGTTTQEPGGEPVVLPVVYDGPDLAEVARLTGLDQDEVVRAHTGTSWRVGFIGFVPGFAYLVGGDPRLHVPRRSTPRTSVPAGSVGLAGEFSGIYPRSSPGGWQLLGRTDVLLFDEDRDPPALLRPGTAVRFEVAG